MKPAKPAKVEVSEEELELTKKLMEEMELRKLLREDRLMRDFNAKDSMTEKQQKVISALLTEKNNLLNDLNVMKTERKCMTDAKQAKDVTDLFAQVNSLNMEIANEKNYIADLEEQIHKESIQIDDHLKKFKGNKFLSDFRHTKENQRADLTKTSMQSKLHAEQVQLSLINKENEELRKKISVLIKNKSLFNQLFEDLIQKLNKGKGVMADVVQQSNIQFNKREEVTRKIQALKGRDAADLRKRQEEMQDLEMRLTEDSRLSVFRNRLMKVREKMSEGAKATKKATHQRQILKKQLKELTNTLDTVKRETGLEDCHKICDLLARQEADNFSLFNYNNELRYQLEVLTEKTNELIKKVEEEQGDALNWNDEEERMKSSMEHKRNSIQDGTNTLDKMYQVCHRQFQELISKVKALFTMTKCDHSLLEELLGDNTDVTEFNYRLYLNQVESALVNLLSLIPRKTEVPTLPDKVSTSTLPKHPLSPAELQNKSGIPPVVDRMVVTAPCSDCEEGKKRPKAVIFDIDE